jgi:hypothetical protein
MPGIAVRRQARATKATGEYALMSNKETGYDKPLRRQLTAFRQDDDTLVYSIPFPEEQIVALRELFDTGDAEYDPQRIYDYPVRPGIRDRVAEILGHELDPHLDYFIETSSPPNAETTDS